MGSTRALQPVESLSKRSMYSAAGSERAQPFGSRAAVERADVVSAIAARCLGVIARAGRSYSGLRAWTLALHTLPARVRAAESSCALPPAQPQRPSMSEAAMPSS